MSTVNDCKSFTEAEWNVICLFLNNRWQQKHVFKRTLLLMNRFKRIITVIKTEDLQISQIANNIMFLKN